MGGTFPARWHPGLFSPCAPPGVFVSTLQLVRLYCSLWAFGRLFLALVAASIYFCHKFSSLHPGAALSTHPSSFSLRVHVRTETQAAPDWSRQQLTSYFGLHF